MSIEHSPLFFPLLAFQGTWRNYKISARVRFNSALISIVFSPMAIIRHKKGLMYRSLQLNHVFYTY
uniref:Uncharacterized protein n=1 Tax=Arundo donax TaxID=35708 RepID=A0A0A9HH49_ARUDO